MHYAEQERKKGMLHLIPIVGSLSHVDYLRPLPSTNKNYQHILAVIDDFFKFVGYIQ